VVLPLKIIIYKTGIIMGAIKITEYLHDLESKQKKDGNNVMIMDESITPTFFPFGMNSVTANDVHGFEISGINSFIKEYSSYNRHRPKNKYKWTNPAITEVVLSRAYNDLGVNSTVSYPVNIDSQLTENNGEGYFRIPIYATATEDLFSIGELDFVSASNFRLDEIVNIPKIMGFLPYNAYSQDVWKILLNPKVKEALLEHITEDCYNDYVNMFMLGDFTGNYDRNYSNYFFCKRKGSKKWESVVAIDHESTINNFFINFNLPRNCSVATAKGLSENILNEGMNFWAPHGIIEYHTTYEKICRLRELMEKGELGDSQLEMIKRIKEYDMSSTMKYFYDKYHIKGALPTKLYDVTSYAWEKSKDIMTK